MGFQVRTSESPRGLARRDADVASGDTYFDGHLYASPALPAPQPGPRVPAPVAVPVAD